MIDRIEKDDILAYEIILVFLSDRKAQLYSSLGDIRPRLLRKIALRSMLEA